MSFISFQLHTDKWPCVNWHKGFNKTKMNLLLEEEGNTPDSPSVQSGKATERFWCLIFLSVCWYLLTSLLSPLSLFYEMSFWVMGWKIKKKQNGSVCGKMKRGKKMGKIEYWSFLHVNSWQYHTMCICKVQLGLIFSYAYICKHFTPLKIINIIFPPFVMVPF